MQKKNEKGITMVHYLKNQIKTTEGSNEGNEGEKL